MECLIDGQIQTVIAIPQTLMTTPEEERSPLYLGGSQYHFAPAAVVSNIVQFQNQALSEDGIKSLMYSTERPTMPHTLLTPATNGIFALPWPQRACHVSLRFVHVHTNTHIHTMMSACDEHSVAHI
jgi:hypothetical protein